MLKSSGILMHFVVGMVCMMPCAKFEPYQSVHISNMGRGWEGMGGVKGGGKRQGVARHLVPKEFRSPNSRVG